MSYARRIAYNTVIQMVGRVLTTITSLTTVSLLNAQLGDQHWGLYVAATTYLGFFAVIADLGVNTLYLREISRYPEKVEEITARFLGFRLVSAAVVLALAPLSALFIPVYSQLVVPILIASVGQFFLILNQIFVSVVQARLQMDRAMISDVVGRVIILVATYLVVKGVALDQRLSAALWCLVVGNGVNTIMMYVFVRPMMRVRLQFRYREWPQLFLSTLPMGALTVLGLIHFKADSVILTLLRPAVEVGIYGNAYKVMEILLTLPSLFVGGLFPAIAQALHNKDDDFVIFLQKAFDILVFVVVPVVGIVILLAPQIIAVLTREHVIESAYALQVLSLAMIPLFIGTLFGNVLLAADQQKKLSLFELVAVVLNIGLNVYFIPLYGLMGAAVVTVVTELLIFTLSARLSGRVLGYAPRLSQARRTVYIGLPTLVLFWLVIQWSGFGFDDVFFTNSRLRQAGMVIGLGGLMTALYLLPFAVFKQFPPVFQEKLARLRGRAL